MLLGPGVHYLKGDALNHAIEHSVSVGARVFRIPNGVRSKASFFDAVQATFPLDPPLARVEDVWDALDDSLSSGLMDIAQERIVIVWEDWAEFQRVAPTEFDVAMDTLKSLPETLADPAFAYPSTKALALVLLAQA